MKIIKLPDTLNWNYEHTCPHCDAVLEVEAKDLRHKAIRGDRTGDADYDKYYAFCVSCNNEFTVPEGKLNKAVKYAAKIRGSGDPGD